jgi:hypothetical protein
MHYANFNLKTMTKTTFLILETFLQGAIAGEMKTPVHRTAASDERVGSLPTSRPRSALGNVLRSESLKDSK